MAIILEEEKKTTNWVGIIGIVAVLMVLSIGSYYLFFKKPELIEVIVPDRLRELNELSTTRFDPKVVVDSPTFRVLRDYALPLPAALKGREDPFRP
jgi:hypothetical protein